MVNKFINRNSVRNYRKQPIENEKILKIKEVINASPTAMNFQSFSAIFVTDQNTKNELMKLNWNQAHVSGAPLIIVFLADLNRVKTSISKQDSYMSAVIDTMIAATTAMSAALDLGLGTCFLGGLRLNDKAANKILNIEGDATVVMGLAVGYEEGKSIHRPKINKVYDDQYHIDKVKEELAAYDILMSSYYKTVFNKDTNFTTISAESLKKLDATTSASNSAQKVKK